MIVEERTYHVHTGKLNEVVRLYAEEGTEVQQQHLASLHTIFDGMWGVGKSRP